MFFVVVHAFRNLYTPPKTPYFPTGPARLLVVIKGFPHHFIDTGASNNVGFIDILGFKLKNEEELLRRITSHSIDIPTEELKSIAIIGTLSFLTQYPLRLASTSTKQPTSYTHT